jgi:hypothetical protein
MPYKINPVVPNKTGGQMDPADIMTRAELVAYLDLAFDAGLIYIAERPNGDLLLADRKELDG